MAPPNDPPVTLERNLLGETEIYAQQVSNLLVHNVQLTAQIQALLGELVEAKAKQE